MSDLSETMPNLARVLTPTPPQPVDERTLVARAADGDRRAARALYEAHAPRVHRVAYRLCRDRDLAADLVQDVFVQVFRQLKTFRGESAFGTWLYQVTLRTSLNAMRKVRRLRERETDLDEALHYAHPVSAIDPDLRDALALAIEALPESLRVALVMHELEGYTHGEIGAALGIAEGTSKKRVFDARGRLRAALGAFGSKE